MANEQVWDTDLTRVDAVRGLELLGTPPEERFDRITRMAGDLLGMPMSFLSLMDLDRQFLKARVGLPFGETRREESICTHTVSAGRLLEIPDAAHDPRYAGKPAVAGPPHVRFYAGQPLRDQDGNVLGTLCVADRVPRTLTEWQREQLAGLARWAELELAAIQTARAAERARKARADFVSVVSHELRTPLTSIHGSLELVGSGRFGELSPQVERLVRIAATNTDRLIRLTEDVLVLSRLQDGVLRLRLADVGLDEVVSASVDAVAGVAEKVGVAVSCSVPALRLRGDHDRLVQVFTNLLANALQVAPGESVVRVGGGVRGAQVSVDVCDQGPGVPQDQLDRIFEPFVQLEGSAGGAGLGLAITRGIVTAHCGSVMARSGGGTTFTVTLPIAGPDTDRPWW